jgi:hypothetical protein
LAIIVGCSDTGSDLAGYDDAAATTFMEIPILQPAKNEDKKTVEAICPGLNVSKNVSIQKKELANYD